MRRPFLPAFLLLALALPACDQLETLDPDTCGNGVVDRYVDAKGVEQGEDCDGLKVDGFDCRTPDQTWACSFSCKPDRSCPVGYGCGTDSVCRKATGSFETAPFANGPSQAQQLLAGDFDADNVADIVGIEPGRVRINFAGDTGTVQQVFLPAIGRPSIGRLGALSKPVDGDETDIDETDDLMLALDLGLGALVSNGDRTFSPKTYGSITFGDLPNSPEGKPVTVRAAIPVAFDALPDATNHPGDETVALFALEIGDELRDDGAFATFSTGGSGAVFDLKGTRPDNLTGPPVTANFDNDPCQEIVFPHTSGAVDPSVSDKVQVYKACVPGKNPGEWEWRDPKKNPESAVVAEIDAGGVVVGRGYAYDVNADGNTDLLLTVVGEMGLQLNLAYSLGNGKFDSGDPSGPTPVLGNNEAHLYAVLDNLPLAFGRLDNDAYLDVVESGKVRFGFPSGQGQLDFDDVYTPDRLWNEALITDLNADGRPDVVACTNGAADIDILNNTGTALWNPFTLSTDGTVANLTAGDFDGDLVSDIVFQDMLSSQESLLTIAYGRPSAGPEPPAEIGTFPDVEAITAGNVLTFGDDAITDLGVVSHVAGDLSLSFFPGASNRVEQTPYLLADKQEHVHVPLHTELGFLRPWDENSGDEAHADVAAIAFNPPRIEPGDSASDQLEKFSTSMYLWGLFGVGEASFSALDTATCPLPHGAFFLPPIREATSVLVSSVPVGQAGQVLVVTPHIQASKMDPGTLDVSELVATAHFGAGGGSCEVDSAMRLDSGQLLFRARLVDLNGNGVPELLAIQGDYAVGDLSGLLLQQSSEPNGAPPVGGGNGGQLASKLVVFWDGQLGQGEKLVPSVPDGQPDLVSDYAVGDFTGDGVPEVVVVGSGPQAVYRVAESGAALELSPSGVSLDLADARAVLLADADGDGVMDMAVASGSQLEVFRGIPKKEAHKEKAP